MHFNDLILRFRAITLTAFVTLIGAAVAIGKYFSLSESSLGWLILTLPVTLWSTAFIIDFFYYHRLLLGSVTEALKFDGSHKLKSYGLFGMTTCISEHVHPPASKALVALYYAIPVMVLILLSFFVF